MNIDIETYVRLKAEYACFNGQRTLSRLETGSPSYRRVAGGVILADSDFPEDDYVNRLSILASSIGREGVVDLHPLAVEIFSGVDEDQRSLAGDGYHIDHNLLFCAADVSQLSSDEVFGIEIKCLQGDGREEFLQAVCSSIGKKAQEEILRAKAQFYCIESFRCYLAYIEGALAGLATLFISGKYGWLANAFTFPEHRNRGVQTALIRRRVNDALELELEVIVSDVEADSQSLRNLQRAGLQLNARSTVWVKS